MYCDRGGKSAEFNFKKNDNSEKRKNVSEIKDKEGWNSSHGNKQFKS